MRVLLLFRGAPGCGKSTYIEEHNLKQYTLSADEIRLQLQAPILDVNGDEVIRVDKESEVWALLFQMLEKRMSRGDFTVIDATNSKTSEMTRYKEFANKYRYRIYLVDMTSLPIEECKARNLSRPKFKHVPELAIDKMYARFATQKVPSGITVLKPDELDKILYKPMNLDKYKRIHIIGDLHGCFQPLKDYLGGDLKEDEVYIFLGDYTDRGPQNVELLQFLISIYKKPNVVLLEGNHENYVRNFASNIDDYPKFFRESTLMELHKAINQKELDKSELRQLCRKFGQVCYFTYGDKTILCCHGGISGLKSNPIFIATEQLIRGVGRYEDYSTVAKSFLQNTPENYYLVNGHRNIEELPVQVNEKCFNLEGRIEFGGFLRVVTLDKNGFNTFEIKNNNYIKQEEVKDTSNLELTPTNINTTIELLRNNVYINEKKQGDISSFNFSREAFNKGIWNNQTIKARGLFINTKTNKVSSRGYDKFFNCNQVEDTKILNLKHTLKFPVTAYVKENGFLGMISFNHEEDRIMFSTKSTLDSYSHKGDVINILIDLFNTKLTLDQQFKIREYLKNNDKTILVECVDNERDPHIISYGDTYLFLLDIVDNSLDYNHVPYEELQILAQEFGLTCKEKAFTFDSWDTFYPWYLEITDEEYIYNGKNIEGFVVEDSVGFMVKFKLYYYNYWKKMRGLMQSVIKNGSLPNHQLGSLFDAQANYLYGFLKEVRMDYLEENTKGGKAKYRLKDDYNFLKTRDRFYQYLNDVYKI